MPPHTHEIIHKALASDIRRSILLSLSKGDKYLSEIASELNKQPQTIDFHLRLLEEIGLVESESRDGKKFYSVKDPRILDFLKEGKTLPHELHPRPPHEIILEEIAKLKEQLDRIEAKIV